MKRDLGRFAGALIAVVIFFGSTDAGEVEYYLGKSERILVGPPIPEKTACAHTKAIGITSMENWQATKSPVKLGGTGSGPIVDVPKILQVALGLPIQLVLGYKGTADIRLAAEGGELAGACWSWEAIKSTWTKGLDSGDVHIVLQALPKP